MSVFIAPNLNSRSSPSQHSLVWPQLAAQRHADEPPSEARKVMRMNTPGDAWECPEVKPYDRRGTKPKSVVDMIPLQAVG